MAQVSQMISMCYYLLGGKINSGGIQIREVFYHVQQASKWYKSSQLPYAFYDSILSTVMGVLMLSCQEISRKCTIYTKTDFLTMLSNEIQIKSVAGAVLASWVALYQQALHKRKCVYEFVLASLEYRKRGLYEFTLWCCLHAWKECFHSNLQFIHVRISFIYSLITHSLTHSLILSFSHSLIHSFSHSLILSFFHSFFHFFTL